MAHETVLGNARHENSQLDLTKGPSHIMSAVNYKSLLIWGQGY